VIREAVERGRVGEGGPGKRARMVSERGRGASDAWGPGGRRVSGTRRRARGLSEEGAAGRAGPRGIGPRTGFAGPSGKE